MNNDEMKLSDNTAHKMIQSVSILMLKSGEILVKLLN